MQNRTSSVPIEDLLASLTLPNWLPFSAWLEHLPFAMYIVAKAKPDVLVELGTHYGASYCAFCEAALVMKLDAAFYAVDTWEGDEHAGHFGNEVYDKLAGYHDPRYGSFSRLIRKRFEETLGYFANGSIDILHIDGYHTYEAVQNDFETWLPKVSQRGIILFHDINVHRDNFGVWKLWEELKPQYPHFSFVHGHGLGVLAVGETYPDGLDILFDATAEQEQFVRQYFAYLGARWQTRYQLNERNDQLEQHKRVIAKRDEQLEQHKQVIAERDEQLEQHKQVIAERDEQLSNVDAEYRGELDYYHQTIVGRDQQIEQLEQTIANLNTQLQGVSTSISWRITSPLRFSKRVIVGFGRWIKQTAQRTAWFVAWLVERPRRVAKLAQWTVTFQLFEKLNELYYFRAIAPILASQFDAEWYLDQYMDVAESGMDPLYHYYFYGAPQGYDPNSTFDTDWYIREYTDVARSGVNPLLHYIEHGKDEGRKTRGETAKKKYFAERPIQEIPTPPPVAEWDVDRNTADAQIDVIIPTYGQYAETINTIYTVLQAEAEPNYNLVVIDDGSPDPDLSETLDELAERNYIQLIRNATNVGFVASVNIGMQVNQDTDVILLNSDTGVYNDWLARLHKAAYHADDIGTVTPLSNNAEICSYPVFCENYPYQMEIDDSKLDQLAAQVNRDTYIELPTAIGFCMYIRRDCLDDIGLFDEEQFGRGYGEENDFCRRAMHKGWRHILAADTFVHHYGGVSFGDEKQDRVKQNLALVNQLYPDYLSEVHQFIQDDPVKDTRQRLDIARMQARTANGAMLFVSHGRGGGTDRHVQEMAKQLEDEGVAVFLLESSEADPGTFHLHDPVIGHLPNLETFDLIEDFDGLIATLQQLNIRHMHVHHLLDAGKDAPVFIHDIAAQLDIDYDFTAHDYFAVCPRVNLIDGSGFYCGQPSVNVCEQCVAKNGSPAGRVNVHKWRQNYEHFLQNARQRYTPSIDTSQRLQPYFPELEFVVRPHLFVPTPSKLLTSTGKNDTRSIAIIGAIGKHKGSQIVLDCARLAHARDYPVHFNVVGYTDINKELAKLPNVTITGAYTEDTVHTILDDLNCEIAWFPAVWPETFSYTLSIALEVGLFPVAFDMGAISSRLRKIDWGYLMPIQKMTRPSAVLSELINIEPTPVPDDLHAQIVHRYDNLLGDYYGIADAFGVPEHANS